MKKNPAAVAIQRRREKNRMMWHRCSGCGARAEKYTVGRHYCSCNPSAPFRMIAMTVEQSAAAVLGRLGGRVKSEAKTKAARENAKKPRRRKSNA